jgi:hypothetical protein
MIIPVVVLLAAGFQARAAERQRHFAVVIPGAAVVLPVVMPHLDLP